MSNQPSWLQLAKEFKNIPPPPEPLRAEWFVYEGSEDYGIWLLRPGGSPTDEVRATFSLLAARVIKKLGISPIPTPQPSQHFADWDLYCRTLGEISGPNREPIDAVPYGLSVEDRDAVDPYTRSWLEWLLRNTAAWRAAEGEFSLRGRTYKTFTGTIEDVCEASSVSCTRIARNEIGARRIEPLAPKVKERVHSAPDGREQASDRASRRQALVNPILERRRWTRGRLVTASGVGKATVYGYLDGTRVKIAKDNRKALADALDLRLEQLPL